MSFPMKLKRDIEVTYIEEIDCTIVWQYMYLEEERHGQPDIEHIPVQQAILGWYHGEPNEADTKHYSNSTVIGDYHFGGDD